MDNQNNIQDELRSMNSGLPVNNSQLPFSVPEGYFNGLAAQILAKVKEQASTAADELQELSPLLAKISKTGPYILPEGYFEENLSVLPPFTKEESPVLAAIGKTFPYQVPQGYFEHLPQQIVTGVIRPKARVVPFFSRTWLKVAAAAVIGGAIILGGYQLLNDSTNEPPTALTYTTGDTTENLVAKNETPTVVQEIKNVSTEDLDAFINTVPLNKAKLQTTASSTVERKEVKELLKDISATELDAFLEQLPTADADLFVID